ncbi:triose-phosphate isomerase [Pseudomonas mangrovi]|uniref:Triosephosphate isomerase n=1 Tax=Pseudomonas mangrovi TaxID=2161748 RepID=A0A2T5P876_9PSED|nr:triose-phosphate isomerase [Pseudomonas mangrovi]PTU73948.1 triose-phosphate isomerase [Pseudomonas mangrovi]
MRRPLVAGNWKMNGTRASVAELLDGLRQEEIPAGVEVVVFPSLIHVAQAVSELAGRSIGVGAQDCAIEQQPGALTGEVAACQLRDAGCSMVLVGHSERRLILGEADAVVVCKFVAAQTAGLVPVLCVGETLEQRESGQTLEVVARQVAAVLDACGAQSLAGAVLAYEPVWAIGTGLTASPGQAQEVHAAIRAQVARLDEVVAGGLRILYGGSVKAANAAELFAMPDIDGGLVGGASLNANEFGAICRAAGN